MKWRINRGVLGVGMDKFKGGSFERLLIGKAWKKMARYNSNEARVSVANVINLFFSSSQPLSKLKSPTQKFGDPTYVKPLSSPRYDHHISAPARIGHTLYTPRPSSSRSPPHLSPQAPV